MSADFNIPSAVSDFFAAVYSPSPSPSTSSDCLCVGLKKSTIAAISFLIIGFLTMIGGAFITGHNLNVGNGVIITGFVSLCLGVAMGLVIVAKKCYQGHC